MPRELDVVRFLVPIGDFPAGTTGTLVLAYSRGGVVEVSGTDEEVSIDYEDVELVSAETGEHLAVGA